MQKDIEQKIDELMRTQKAPENKPKNRKWLLICMVCAFLLLTTFLVNILNPSSPTSDILGKITSPNNGDHTSRNIKITGFTENLPPDRPYVLIAVDVQKFNLSWPKKPFIQPNIKFQTSFYEGGPSEKCSVSLYAVNNDMYKKINLWFKEERLGGMPLLPDRFRIDSITLKLQR